MKLKKNAVKPAQNPVEQINAKSPTTVAKVGLATTPANGHPAPATPAPIAAKAPAPTKVSAAAAAPKPALTTIEVKLDVGFGNAVFLRGKGAGLNWEHGLPLSCVDGKTWRWSAEARDPITFKLLINDQIWSSGNDLSIEPGQKLEVAPQFA